MCFRILYLIAENTLLIFLFLLNENVCDFFIFPGLKTLQLYSGLIAIEAYMQTIIKSSHSSLSPEISSIIFGLIQFPAGKTFVATIKITLFIYNYNTPNFVYVVLYNIDSCEDELK